MVLTRSQFTALRLARENPHKALSGKDLPTLLGVGFLTLTSEGLEVTRTGESYLAKYDRVLTPLLEDAVLS